MKKYSMLNANFSYATNLYLAGNQGFWTSMSSMNNETIFQAKFRFDKDCESHVFFLYV